MLALIKYFTGRARKEQRRPVTGTKKFKFNTRFKSSQQGGIKVPTPSSHRGKLPTPASCCDESESSDSTDSAVTSGSARSCRRHYSDPKIPPCQVGEDVENYLMCFECCGKTWTWQKLSGPAN